MEILQTREFWYFFIPIVVTLIIYFVDKSIKAERKHLLVLFKSNKSLSKRIQEKLKGFIEEFDASNAIAYPERNVTYGTWLEMMSEEYKSSLSEELYEFAKKGKIPKPTLLSMSDSLNKQNEALRLMEMDMNLVIKKAQESRV
ncbi:MAG TPA: hypothetical protein VFL76_00280 [Edaphocola sp.]|nr:hypothetical protein [Edaphocola sp.]